MVKKIVDSIIKSKDDYIIGYADLGGVIPLEYSKYSYVISIAQKLDEEIISSLINGPTKEYYDLYKKVNQELTDVLNDIARLMTDAGIENCPIQPTFEDYELENNYLETLRTPFSHKFAATRAGIGWIGKTDLLITSKFGPRVRLASILFNDPEFFLDEDKSIDKSKCGDCKICVEHCPANASNGKLWDINTDRDEFYDAFKCREKCRELCNSILGIDNSVCGICLSVCPIGKKIN